MLKIESNLKINGMHWGLAFVDGIAYTVSAALAAKLMQKGYVVTDQPEAGSNNTKQGFLPSSSSSAQDIIGQTIGQPDRPVAAPIDTKQRLSSTPPSSAQADIIQTGSPSEQPAITPAEPPAPKSTKSRKRAVTADAADKH